MSDRTKILVVDDELFNLDIMCSFLEGENFDVVQAEDGDIALQKLRESSDIAVIVLDRMMPRMGGMEVLAELKSDPQLRNIPVIMQTAAASSKQVLEGIQAGVYYYLTKPYKEVMLTSIVKSALKDAKNKRELGEEVRKHHRVLGLMEHSRFHFRTIEEAKNLSYFIANCFPDPISAVYALNEILVNAIEHGNLGITYGEKAMLMAANMLHIEIERRLAMPQNLQKYACLTYQSSESEILVTIRDEGEGFDWRPYMHIAADRAFDPNGRGIATASMMGVFTLEYQGNGNEVLCRFRKN